MASPDEKRRESKRDSGKRDSKQDAPLVSLIFNYALPFRPGWVAAWLMEGFLCGERDERKRKERKRKRGLKDD